MAKFKYRMQNILDIKMKLETQAQIAFGIANQKYQKEQEILQTYLFRRAMYEKELKESMTDTLDLKKVSHARANFNSMKTIVRRQMLEVHKAELELEDARRKLNEVMQDRKAHEKLKEKEFELFKKELEYEEAKEIDELVSYTFNEKDETS